MMDISQNKFAGDAPSISETALVENQNTTGSTPSNLGLTGSGNPDSSFRPSSSPTVMSAGAVPPSTVRDFTTLLLAYLLFRLPWIFMLPMTEAPDEFAHFWVIKFLREHWRLPHANEVAAGGASSVYGSLPQLGYIPHVLACTFTGTEHFALCERFGSTLMGAVMLFAAYKCGQILFAKNRLFALAVPAAIVCHPQLVFIQSYANSDSTSSGLSSLLIWLMLATVSRGLNFSRTVWMGALVGWLAITKYSGLAIIPVLGLAMIASIFIHGTSIALALSAIISSAVLAAVLSVWWFVQNAQQYPGDFMGTHTMYKSWAETFHREMHYYLPPSHIIKSLRWWRMTFFSYWGLFGYMNKYLWRPVYIAYVMLVSTAVLGGIVRGGLFFRNMIKARSLVAVSDGVKPVIPTSRIDSESRQAASDTSRTVEDTSRVASGSSQDGGGADQAVTDTSRTAADTNSVATDKNKTASDLNNPAMGTNKAATINTLMWSSLALTVAVNIASMIWASVYNYGGPQGRYLITSEIPIMALIVAGLSLCGKKLGKNLVVLFLLFNTAISIYSWFYLFHLYHGWHFDPLV